MTLATEYVEANVSCYDEIIVDWGSTPHISIGEV